MNAPHHNRHSPSFPPADRAKGPTCVSLHFPVLHTPKTRYLKRFTHQYVNDDIVYVCVNELKWLKTSPYELLVAVAAAMEEKKGRRFFPPCFNIQIYYYNITSYTNAKSLVILLTIYFGCVCCFLYYKYVVTIAPFKLACSKANELKKRRKTVLLGFFKVN